MDRATRHDFVTLWATSTLVLKLTTLLLVMHMMTGFTAYAESDDSLGSACGGPIEASEGVVRSPNFPDFYTMSTICAWRIGGASPNAEISLRMLRYELEPLDRILLYNSSPPALNTERFTLTSPMTQRLFVIGSVASVAFVPHASSNSSRFLAWFSSKSVDKNSVDETIYDCGNDSVGSGDLMAPGFPLTISESAICAWTLRTETKDTVLRLEVISFNLKKANGERLLIYSPYGSTGRVDVLYLELDENNQDQKAHIIKSDSAVIVFIAERNKSTAINKDENMGVSSHGGSAHVRFSSVQLLPQQEDKQIETYTIPIIAACFLCVALAAAVAAVWLWRRRRRLSSGGFNNKDRTNMLAVAASFGHTATEGDPTASGWPRGASDIISVAPTDGLYFGGLARPLVVLLGVLDTAYRAAVARSLRKILNTLGGCDVHDELLVHCERVARPGSGDGEAYSDGNTELLRARLLAADRIVVLASAGARLIAEAARSGCVYARCFRSEAAYFSVSEVFGLCTRYPQLRMRTLIVTCCDEDENVPSECCHSGDDNGSLRTDVNKEVGASKQFSQSESDGPSGTTALAAAADVRLPHFRLVDDLQSLVGALHGASELKQLVWSCANEFQECTEARKLERHVAAVRTDASAAAAAQRFLAAFGPVIECAELLQGRSTALPLSICESTGVHHDQLTDVISVISIVPPSTRKDDEDEEWCENYFLTYGGERIESPWTGAEDSCQDLLNFDCQGDLPADIVSVLSFASCGGDGGTVESGDQEE